MKARTLSVSVEAAPGRVYAFAADPLNLPKWAAGLGRSISRIDGRWIVETPSGIVTIDFTPENALGVLDHTVTLPDGARIFVPIRVVANGAGSEVLFTLFQAPGMSAAQFEKDAALVASDLRALKKLLEALPQ